MGLRFRKSIKVAPGVKLNLNKNSASVTVGTKRAHYTVNSNGKKTTSAGIPGTGLSYVSTKNSSKKKNSNLGKKLDSSKNKESKKIQPKKKGGCLGSILLVFAILCLIFAFIPSDDKKEDGKKANQQNIAEEQLEENMVSQTDGEEIEPSIDDANNNLPENNLEPEPVATTQPENTVDMVWLPESGTKYHSNSSCSNMDNPRQVTLDEAVNAGYEPCKKCY